jgi:hypothetical protein
MTTTRSGDTGAWRSPAVIPCPGAPRTGADRRRFGSISLIDPSLLCLDRATAMAAIHRPTSDSKVQH